MVRRRRTGGDDGRIAITRNGKAVAVLLVPNDDDDLEHVLLGRSPRLEAMLNRSRRSIQPGEAPSEEDSWNSVRKPSSKTKSRCRGKKKYPADLDETSSVDYRFSRVSALVSTFRVEAAWRIINETNRP